MPNRGSAKADVLQGTLDLLILRTLRWGPAHGHAVAKAIERGSDDVLLVEQGFGLGRSSIPLFWTS